MTVEKKQKVEKEVESGTDERFANVKFAGTFREYQQRVIDNCAKHLNDKRIHIVAAPGSGKTVLGLELVRMIGKPALILSPTIAIREQWKDRFEEMFVPQGDDVNDFVSCSLYKPKLLTSITYQGLYTSYRKIAPATQAKPGVSASLAKADDDADENSFPLTQENYSAVNIIQLMDEHKISTICLDEAHHLRAEWQKALQEFIRSIQHKVTVIALTATPPYDSKKSEWDKYIAVCGPIDEEIFVPELVRTNTLCPHQDYIYYNFPTDAELRVIENYKNTVTQTINNIISEAKFLDIIKNSAFYVDPEEFEDELSDRPELVKSIIAFFEEHNEKPNKLLVKSLERDNRDVKWDLNTATILFQGMLSDDLLFEDKDREYVKSVLSRQGLVEKNKVYLTSNAALETLLITSIGKLNSISKIVDEEWKNLGDNIRLLVLTDYIRVNSSVLGSDKEINELGVVPIFELLRRKQQGLKLAAISGKIVIVPENTLEGIRSISKKDNIKFKTIAIKGTEHCELRFDSADSAQKIGLITKAFNAGIVNGIVGTKSLLGEGWDSPVINTLILASFVGSFMLSNQMRGRAIRIDKYRPDKVSNIWHLTAILPEHLMSDTSGSTPPSADYATLERRFHGFMGVSYDNDVIESSLQRANTLTAPFTNESINRANKKTFELARDREAVKLSWQLALAKSSNEVLIQNEIPKPKRGFIPSLIIKPSHYRTIKKVTHAIMKTFKELGLINRKAKPTFEKDYKNEKVNVGIFRCTQIEKSIFHQSLSDVFTAIDSQKYIIVKTRNDKLDFRASFAVPEIFSPKKEQAEVFREKMSKRIANFELLYTRSNDGKKHLMLAKKKAYVNKTNNEIQTKMRLREK